MKSMRMFRRALPLATLLFLAPAACQAQSSATVTTVDAVPAGRSALYVTNRPPLQPAPLVKLPLGSIKAQGWLRRQLELDARGMSGNLPQVSEFVKDGCAWASPTGEGHHGWEEPVYWLRGYASLGYALQDPAIMATTRKWIDAMIASRQPDGYFGPKELKTRNDGKADLWPHTLALNTLQTYYDFTKDQRAFDLLVGYCKWLQTRPDEEFSRNGLVNIRGIEYIATLQWLYNRTGEAWTLELADRIQKVIADWTERLPTGHNVDIAQCFRGPAQYWVQTGNDKYRQATHKRYDELMGEYGQFPGGGFASDENIRPGSIDPRQGFETCGFVEFMHSFQILTRIEGDPAWADRSEEIAFNSYPAALTPDHKGLHYVTCANMVSQDFRDRHITFTNGWVKTGYSPTADYRCCQHNHSIGWPFYAEELWLATADGGLCASLYAASEVKARVGDGTEIQIVAEGDYPFSDTLTFKLSSPKAVAFPLYLRVPQWCEKPKVTLNGRDLPSDARPRSYLRIERTWKDGDTVTLQMPMHLATKTWQKNKNAVSVRYGPIWFALQIGEEWKEVKRLPNWPGWEVSPSTPWNYALVLSGPRPEDSFKLVRKPGAVPAEPFTAQAVPLRLEAKARRLPEWTLGPEKWIAPLQMSPAKTEAPVENITLIPLGAARLRISSFPTAGTDASATLWKTAKLPLAAAFTVKASHVFDQLDAVNDGFAPERSNDGSLPRFTWWDHKGTAEWIEYSFDKPRAVSSASVFWFDDTHGCRVPASWRVLYRKDGKWVPVKLVEGAWKALEGQEAYEAKKDQYNTVRFNEVQTDGLRVEVQLQKDFSGGILEWKVNE